MHALHLNMHLGIQCYAIKWDGDCVYSICWSQGCVGEMRRSDVPQALNLHTLQEEVWFVSISGKVSSSRMFCSSKRLLNCLALVQVPFCFVPWMHDFQRKKLAVARNCYRMGDLQVLFEHEHWEPFLDQGTEETS